MILLCSIMVAILGGMGFYLLMRRHAGEVLLGLLLFSQSVNLLLICMGGWSHNEVSPITSQRMPVTDYADPVPMALILTAIVIGFGATAFLLVLAARAHEETGSVTPGEEARKEGEL